MKNFLAVAAVVSALSVSWGQTPSPRTGPRLEPIAETKLIMDGLAHANFRGLERLLRQKPAEDQAWIFARGQALLLAETANLMMLRPPKMNPAQNAWFEKATDLRHQATLLAIAIGQREHERAKAGLINVANSCNRCHQAFNIPVQIAPWEDPPAPGPKAE